MRRGDERGVQLGWFGLVWTWPSVKVKGERDKRARRAGFCLDYGYMCGCIGGTGEV